MYFSFVRNKETEVYRVYLLKITKTLVKSRVLFCLCSSRPTLSIYLFCFPYWQQGSHQGEIIEEE